MSSKKKKKPQVAVIMGSDSDLKHIKEGLEILDKFGISYEVKILSAHRSPRQTHEFAKEAKKRGVKVIIACAGYSAHLAGVIASLTTLPVIGVPVETKSLKGIDSLLSTVQMPSGVPVGCMAIGSQGGKNAALYAVQILSLSSKILDKKLEKFKKDLAKSIRIKNRKLKWR